MTIPPVTPQLALSTVWLVWWASWMAAALWRDRAANRPPVRQELLYRVLTIAGVLLLFGFYRSWGEGVLWHTPTPVGWVLFGFFRNRSWGEGVLWHTPTPVGWVLFAAALPGFAFTWWARIHLGRLWSSSVTRKADHHIVDTGPYGIVRHPIYTGVTVATLAVAVMRGTVEGGIGFILLTLGWYVKARVEEQFLRAELGAQAYDAYARRVPMLVPFLPRLR